MKNVRHVASRTALCAPRVTSWSGGRSPAEQTEFEQVVYQVERISSSLYVLHLYLAELKEEDGAATAHLLHDELDRQAAALREMMHQPDAPAG